MLLTLPVRILPSPHLILVFFFVALLTLIVYLYETVIRKNDEWSWLALIILLVIVLGTAGWFLKSNHDNLHKKQPIIIAESITK